MTTKTEPIKPVVLVCGKTGAGKSSLIQAMTHKGTVPDSAISDSKPCTEGFNVYETEIATFVDAEGYEPGKPIDAYATFIWEEIKTRVASEEVKQVITSIWYCLDGSGARVQQGDLDFIKKLESSRVKLVVTKSEILRDKQRKELSDELLKQIKPGRIIYVSSHRKDGLETLSKSIDEDACSAGIFASQQIEEYKRRLKEYYRRRIREWEERIDKEADSIIHWGAGRAAAIAIIPIPVADVVPLLTNETYMIYRLGNLYGFSVGENILSSLTGVAGASLAGKLIASFLPGLKIAIAAGVTYGVGKAAKSFFKSGMTLSQEELKREYERAKDEAKKTNWEEHQVKEEN